MTETPNFRPEASPDKNVQSDHLPVQESPDDAYMETSRSALARAEEIISDEDRTRQERAREKLPQTIGLPVGVSFEQILARDEQVRTRLVVIFHIASDASWPRIYDLIEKRLQEAEGEMRIIHGTDRDPLLTEIHRIQDEMRIRRENEARTSFLDSRNATWQNIETRQEALRGIKREVARNIHIPVGTWDAIFGNMMVLPESRRTTIAVSLTLPQAAPWERIFSVLEEYLRGEQDSHSQDRLYTAVVRSALRKIGTFRSREREETPGSEGYAESNPDTIPWSEEPLTRVSGL